MALGLGLYAPETRLLRVLSPARDQPFWYHYNSAPERLVIHVGGGVKIIEWLSIGLGVQTLADLVGNGADVSVDLFNKTVQNGDARLAPGDAHRPGGGAVGAAVPLAAVRRDVPVARCRWSTRSPRRST